LFDDAKDNALIPFEDGNDCLKREEM